MSDAYVIAGARTPIGRLLSAFRDVPAPELGGAAIGAAISRAGCAPADVEEVIFGNVISAGIGQAPARQAALLAGLPPTVAAVTVNKVCGSGLKAVMLAAQAIRAGDARLIVAGGMENMTRAPHLLLGSREGWKMGSVEVKDAMIHDGLWCPFDQCSMGNHAEYTAERFGVTREDQDQYAVESQRRAARAVREGEFADEIVPVRVPQKKGEFATVETDEGPRPGTDLPALSRLRPSYKENGTVTAGNSSMISDGAAAVVVADRETASRLAAPWQARIVAYHTSGTEPRDLFVAPVAAVRGVLEKSGLRKEDIDLYEINEAFAAQMIACIRELNLDARKVNVNGGAIALGHPIGASGARVLVTLLSALVRRNLRRGLASLCLGGGNAVALVVERTED
jgi:acetyl-CoA C-acetyltransferase